MIPNNQASTTEEFKAKTQYSYLLLILITALVIRLIDLPQKWLWYDELQSVTYSTLSVEGIIKSVHLFDPNPPLYYLQLHFWMLFGNSDLWIKLNSVIWSIYALIMVFFLCKDIYGSRIALVASLIFAVSPFAVFYSQEARMYSLLMFLGVSSFFCIQRFVRKNNYLYLVGAILFTVSFLYSHGAGFLILVSLSVYLIWLLLEDGFSQWRVLLKVGLTLLVITVFYIPWLIFASDTSVGHLIKPNIYDVFHTLCILIVGFINHPAWVEWFVVITTICLLVFSLRNKMNRIIGLPFVIVPIIFCIIVSYIYKPIWLYRTLAYTVPFWCIFFTGALFQLGEIFVKIRNHQQWIKFSLEFVTIVFLFICTIFQQTTFSYDWHFRDAARFLQNAAQKGDVIYVPNTRVFWGMGWYFSGPGSVNPLKKKYSLVSSSGVKLVSTSELTKIQGGVNYWLVYRTSDDTFPFKITQSDTVWDFANLNVVQINK